jgi:hypothetical protein
MDGREAGLQAGYAAIAPIAIPAGRNVFGLPVAAAPRVVLVDVGRNQAGVHREPIRADQPFGHAARDDCLEQMPKDVALAKAPMPVLGKGRMIGNFSVETKPAEPEIGEI